MILSLALFIQDGGFLDHIDNIDRKRMNYLPEKIIDFHVHLFPDDFFEAIWKFFKKNYGLDVIDRLYARQCVEYLRDHGVGTIVYSNYAHKKGVANLLNAWNKEFLDGTDDIYCFAAFHPDDEDAMAIAEDIISHPKVLGFKLQLLVQEFYPFDVRLFDLYELVMEKNKRILFHAGTGPVGNRYVGIDNFRKILVRYPDLPANIAHMGGFEFKEFFDLLENHKQLYLDTAFCFLPEPARMYTLGSWPIETYKDRILYGSDFPNIVFPRQVEIDALADMDLSEECYQRIFQGNARHLIALHTSGNHCPV